MASLDHRLNPLFSIKECMTCGALYTADFCCSKGGLEDKILVPKPPQNCATYGKPVDGLYCRHCVFVRKCLNEGWYTIHDENKILNTSKSSKHNTNVVSAPQEPFVFNQDPGVNSSQSPLQINHNCCYKCGDLLDGIFCQQCTCKSCGNGAHIGYNCPPKAPIISNPEQCNQTINELPQTLPSVHPTCNYKDENSFTYDSKPNSFNDSPSVLTHPPQLQFETYLCELCGNNAHYGYDCPPQFPLVYEQEPCYNQNFNDNYFPQNSQSSSQQYNCCENCGGPHETFQCQTMNEDYYDQNSCYDPNSFGFDQVQPQQYTVNHPILNAQKEFLNSQNKLMEQMTSICDMVGQIMQKKEEERRIVEEQAAEDRYWKIPICYDDDEDYTIAITPVLSTKEPVDSLIMEDRRRQLKVLFHIGIRPKAITPDEPSKEPEDPLIMGEKELSTIPEKDKSSVEDLVPIPSGSKEVSDDICDNDHSYAESLLSQDILITSPKIDFLSEEFTSEFALIPPKMDEDKFDEEEVDCYDHDISSDDDSYENIEYVEASPLKLEYDSLEEENEDQEEKEFDLEDIFQIQDVILREKLLNVHRLITNIKSLKNNPTPDFVFNNSLPEFETFSDQTEETRSGSTTTHVNYSFPEYDSFLFEIESDQGGLTSVVISNNSNDPESESFHFDLNPSSPRPPPEPPDVCLNFKPDTAMKKDEDFNQGEIVLSLNVEDVNSFTFVIWTFLPFFTYPEDSLVILSFRSEDLVFDPGISTFHFSLKPVPFILPKDE
ncbi:hypothetical protein Tco_0084418 [Tanacetum coccineum]